MKNIKKDKIKKRQMIPTIVITKTKTKISKKNKKKLVLNEYAGCIAKMKEANQVITTNMRKGWQDV